MTQGSGRGPPPAARSEDPITSVTVLLPVTPSGGCARIAMSVESITAAARACQARAGANGRASTDMARRAAGGTFRIGIGRPSAAVNASTMPNKVTSSGPATSITRLGGLAPVAASTTLDTTSSPRRSSRGSLPYRAPAPSLRWARSGRRARPTAPSTGPGGGSVQGIPLARSACSLSYFSRCNSFG